ncbi:MAG: di-heme oxidoredictase family protein, partial [Terriglobia bacterium]
LSINLLGDGFVEVIDNSTLISIAREQPGSSGGRIAGEVVWVPVLEAPGRRRVGRFGWKDQHGSLLSAVADSLRNEIGITNRLYPTESSPQAQSKSDPEDKADPATGLATIDRPARFIRATQTPPRGDQLARSPAVQAGSEIIRSHWLRHLSCANH